MDDLRLGNTVAIFANLDVLVGIGLLIYELNQDHDAIIGSTQQGLLSLLHESDSWLQDAESAEIVVKAEERGEALTDVEARQFAEWMSGKLNACEHVYERFLERSISEYYWEGWDEGCRALLVSAQGRAVWSERRLWYGRELRKDFDDPLASLE